MGGWLWEEQARSSLNASTGRVEKLQPVTSPLAILLNTLGLVGLPTRWLQ